MFQENELYISSLYFSVPDKPTTSSSAFVHMERHIVFCVYSFFCWRNVIVLTQRFPILDMLAFVMSSIVPLFNLLLLKFNMFNLTRFATVAYHFRAAKLFLGKPQFPRIKLFMLGPPGKGKEVPFRYRGKLISAIAFFQQFKSFIICRRKKLYRYGSASARYRKFMYISISSKVATTTKYHSKKLNFSSSIFNLGYYKRKKTTMTCFYV